VSEAYIFYYDMYFILMHFNTFKNGPKCPSAIVFQNCDNLPLTPALALMKKRNDEVKSGLLRNMPSVFSPGFRPSSFGQQREPWRPPFRSHRSEEEH